MHHTAVRVCICSQVCSHTRTHTDHCISWQCVHPQPCELRKVWSSLVSQSRYLCSFFLPLAQPGTWGQGYPAFRTHFQGRLVPRTTHLALYSHASCWSWPWYLHYPALILYTVFQNIGWWKETRWSGISWLGTTGDKCFGDFNILGRRSAVLGMGRCCGVCGEESDVISKSDSPWYLVKALPRPGPSQSLCVSCAMWYF